MTKTQSKPYWSLSAVIVVFILLTKVPLIFLTVYFATNEIESRLVTRLETELFRWLVNKSIKNWLRRNSP